ncbi:MAG: dTDP-4-dehydrorhamnose reductase, partial [Rhodoferax sp.]|nr:dTDP-4-dehydrorhamnose reductase [Rhodoferax sp.]
MKILLLGSSGQVGWELQRSLCVLGELIALTADSSRNPQGLCGNLSDLDGLANTVQTVKPDVIVNAAAHTAVDKAETEPALARCVNARAPAVLARQAKMLGAWLVHYSTDYVFDGSGTLPWQETDPTGPLNVYGQTKLEGEQAVAQNPQHLILRTSWVYGARGDNFAKTMLRLASERDVLNVIDDQIGAPTSAELLADITAHTLRTVLARPALAGLYHCAASGHTSWHGYAQFVLETAQSLGATPKVSASQVTAIGSACYPTPAKRPLNSRLDTRKLQQCFDLQLPQWQLGVARMLNEVGS